MTVKEIFEQLTNHMLEGIMIHEQFISYYEFLGLDGYARCHEHHYKQESESYRKIYHYFMSTYNMLLPEPRFPQPQIIPESWHKYTRQEVDLKTKQSAVQQGLERWISWEKDTYSFYQQLYLELINNNKLIDAEEIKCLIYDVKEELSKAEQYQLNKIATNYNMIDIIKEQKKIK